MKKAISLALCLVLACAMFLSCGAAGPRVLRSAALILEEPMAEVEDVDNIVGGATPSEAALLPMGAKLHGAVSDKQAAWFAIQTTDDPGAVYSLSLVNKSLGTTTLYATFFDEMGNEPDGLSASDNGIVSTQEFSGLSPDTTYYIRILQNTNSNNYDINYMLVIRDPGTQAENEHLGYVGALADGVNPGTNQDDASLIPNNAKLGGTVSNKTASWFAFETNGAQDGVYQIQLTNETLDTTTLYATVFDELGNELDEVSAEDNGIVSTQDISELAPNTTYYIRILQNTNSNNYDIDYTMIVNAPEDPNAGAAVIEENESAEAMPGAISGTGFSLNGEEQTQNIGYTVGELIDLGFATEQDVTAPVESEAVCDVFVMTKGGVAFDVRAIDPYAGAIPLNDCIVCYFGFSDTTGAVTVGSTIACGSSTRADVAARFLDPFIDEADHLGYQTDNPAREYENDYGAFVISENVRTCDVLFRFDDGGNLNQIVFLAPYLLYDTLADNLAEGELGRLDPDDLDEALEVREDILAKLQECFDDAGLLIAIDTTTGRITMDESILFAFNDATLSDAGKAYLDTFLRVYAQVLLDGEHGDVIRTVQFDGHTDTVGSYEYNQGLSEARANAVLDYCNGSNNAGLSPEQAAAFKAISVAVGHSYDDPVIGPDGQIDMDASRRVEVKFFLNISE